MRLLRGVATRNDVFMDPRLKHSGMTEWWRIPDKGPREQLLIEGRTGAGMNK
ncbi:MAG: hypothetical protein WBD99_08105 [Thermodesulfobacteriota bacterium]